MSEICPKRIIVVGGDVLGRRLVQELIGQGAAVTAVADGLDDGFCEAVKRLGASTVAGDPKDEETLASAGLSDAECLVSVSDSYSLNLDIGLTAKKLNPGVRVIVRLVDAPIAAKLERTFGIRTLSSAGLSAPAFVSAALGGSLAASLHVEGMRIVVHGKDPHPRNAKGVAITPQGLAHGGGNSKFWVECELESVYHHRRHHSHKHRPRSRRASGVFSGFQGAWRRSPPVIRGLLTALAGFVVLSEFVFWRFGGMTPLDAAYFIVTTMTTVGYGDINLQNAPAALKIYGIVTMLAGAGMLATVYAIIADNVLSARLDYMLGRRGVDKADHVVVVGLGKVGCRVAMEIFALGGDVVAVELSDDTENVAAARDHFPVVIGDAARDEVLKLACVDRAATVIAVTNNSVLNLDVALRAKEANPKVRTVMRSHEPAIVDSFRELGLDAVASASTTAAPAFAAAALDPQVVASFEVDATPLQLVRLPASAEGEGGSLTLLRESSPGRFIVEDKGAGLASGSVYALRLKP